MKKNNKIPSLTKKKILLGNHSRGTSTAPGCSFGLRNARDSDGGITLGYASCVFLSDLSRYLLQHGASAELILSIGSPLRSCYVPSGARGHFLIIINIYIR